jgi:hypothetical protein
MMKYGGVTQEKLAVAGLTIPGLMEVVEAARSMGIKYANSERVRAEFIAYMFNLTPEYEDALALFLMNQESGATMFTDDAGVQHVTRMSDE